MTKKTYYTLILNKPAQDIETAVFKIDALSSHLVEVHDLLKSTPNSYGDTDFKETLTPQKLDERFTRAFAKRHPGVFDGVDPSTLSYYRFRSHPKGPAPLMQNYLVSLNEIAEFLVIENGAGEKISFEQLLTEHLPVKKGLDVLHGKSLAALSQMKDLGRIFSQSKVTQPQNRCIEDLLMSDAAHHWSQAAEQINAEESVSDVIEALISIYESTKDVSIQRALLTAVHRVAAMSAGKMESVPALNSQKVAEFEAKGKSMIQQFLGSRHAKGGHADIISELRTLAQ